MIESSEGSFTISYVSAFKSPAYKQLRLLTVKKNRSRKRIRTEEFFGITHIIIQVSVEKSRIKFPNDLQVTNTTQPIKNSVDLRKNHFQFKEYIQFKT